jgi:hypothetical protein
MEQHLVTGANGDGYGSVGHNCATEIIAALRRGGHLTKEGAVSLELTRSNVHTVLETHILNEAAKTEYLLQQDNVIDVVMRSRYSNLYSLLKDQISEKQYMGIVRNQILVDIQGKDLLYQIFTSNILQRNAGEEAPFLEFIQRVCSSIGVIKPGCGGFGTSNH